MSPRVLPLRFPGHTPRTRFARARPFRCAKGACGLLAALGGAVRQGRIHAMSLRPFVLVVPVLIGAFAVVGCGVRDEGEVVSENVLTAELVVPPAAQVTVEPPTATVAPTATTKVVEEVAGESAEGNDLVRVNVPNRGYNSYGALDAPITMFDFSDFL